METRAHFILIGLFTLLGIIGGLGFFLWLASVQIDRQYAQYGIVFENVSGLDQSADVLFNGVNVGRVTDIRIWEEDPSKAFVTIEIDAATPVASDTIARLESQGVTGVASIALYGGLPDAPPLAAQPDGLPIIPARQSSLQSLVNSAPDLLQRAANLITQLEQLTGQENRDHVTRILENVDDATAGLERAMTDFSDIAETLRTATGEVTKFVDDFDGMGAAARSSLENADTAFAAVTQTFENANDAIDTLTPAIESANTAIATIEDLFASELPALADDLRTTLGNADTALASADQAFVRADGIMDQQLGPTLRDARDALVTISDTMSAINADVPVILADLRAGVTEARQAIGAVAPGLRDFGQLGGEARALVRTLNELSRRIGQDPAGFLLNNRVPDYRR